MDGELIKSFLVGLGFGVDDASLSKFNKAISSASLKVAALYTSIQATATGIAYGIAKISQGFEDMAYEYRLIAPAINKALILRQELFKAYNAAGINILKTVQSSIKLNLSLTKTKFALEAIYKSVGAKFFGVLTKASDTFRDKLYKNMPKIQNALERFVFFIFKAFDATVILGERVWSILTRIYDFFLALHKATDGWSTVIIAVIAAWKLLNLAFLATPLGAIIAGLVAILALFDDFETWKEGGESFFDWAPFVPVIDAVKGAFESLWEVLKSIADVFGAVIAGFIELYNGNFDSFIDDMADAGKSLVAVFNNLFDLLKGNLNIISTFAKFAGGVIQSASNYFTQPNVQANLGADKTNAGGVSPVSNSSVSNQSSNVQHIKQETNINVNSSADAQSVGRHVGSEQSRVNQDMARNFMSPTQ